jgi:hypothetical protein
VMLTYRGGYRWPLYEVDELHDDIKLMYSNCQCVYCFLAAVALTLQTLACSQTSQKLLWLMEAILILQVNYQQLCNGTGMFIPVCYFVHRWL